MKAKQILAVAVSVSLLAACTEPDGSPGRGIENGGALSKTDVGVGVGVVAGGIAGGFVGAGVGKAIAVVGGMAIGGAAGYGVGHYLDEQDRASNTRATHYAVDSNSQVDWNNPNNGNRGTVTPGQEYQDDNGRLCRKYTQKIYVDGKPYIGHGNACRDADGTWTIIK